MGRTRRGQTRVLLTPRIRTPDVAMCVAGPLVGPAGPADYSCECRWGWRVFWYWTPGVGQLPFRLDLKGKGIGMSRKSRCPGKPRRWMSAAVHGTRNRSAKAANVLMRQTPLFWSSAMAGVVAASATTGIMAVAVHGLPEQPAQASRLASSTGATGAAAPMFPQFPQTLDIPKMKPVGWDTGPERWDGGPLLRPAVSSVPARVLTAYQNAVGLLGRADPGCRLSTPLLAAIGRVESGHALGGRVDAKGTTTVRILGPRLDGGLGVASISDTDQGKYDGDPVWDRAVGPMQFIPSTWSRWGADGNGDGVADPHNVDDAALAAGRYLCAAGGDVGSPQGLRRAVLAYNNSEYYLNLVLAWMRVYSGSVTVDPGVLVQTVQQRPSSLTQRGSEPEKPPRQEAPPPRSGPSEPPNNPPPAPPPPPPPNQGDPPPPAPPQPGLPPPRGGPVGMPPVNTGGAHG